MPEVFLRKLTSLALLTVAFATMLLAASAQKHGGKQKLHMAPYTNPAAKAVTSWLTLPSISSSQIGIEIMDLPSGQILFSLNGTRRFTPASTAKIFTTACALDLLGSDFRYRTQLVASGQLSKDKLDGNLIIVPVQDPSFETNDLAQLLAQVSARKIKRVEGQLVTAAVPGGCDQFNTGWLVEDWGQDWMPVSSNLVLDHNIAPGKDPGRGVPAVELQATAAGTAMLHCLLKSSLAPGWVLLDPSGRSAKVFRGSFPSMSQTSTLVVANPDDYNLTVAATMLKHNGVQMKFNPAPVRSDQQLFLGEHLSKPITEIIRLCLKDSDNLYAQQLLRTIGAKSRQPGTPDHITLEESGLEHIKHWLSTIGIAADDVVLVDGCGLSRKNFVTPHALNMVLKHMSGQHGTYIDLLRLEGSSKSSFRFKTGAMDSIRSVSGVVHTTGGNTLAVTVIVNGHLPQVGSLRSSIYSLTSALEFLPAYQVSEQPPAARSSLQQNGAKVGSKRSTQVQDCRQHHKLRSS